MISENSTTKAIIAIVVVLILHIFLWAPSLDITDHNNKINGIT
jgi:hypothetical protein